MRIALLTSSYPRFDGDGTAPFIKSIAEGLKDAGNDVYVIAPYDPQVDKNNQSDPPVNWYKYSPIRWLNIMGHSHALKADIKLDYRAYLILPLFFICSLIKLISVVVEKKVDIIYAHWVIPNGFIAAIGAQLCNKPLVINLHGSDVFVAEKNPLFKKAARWVFKQAATTIVCSQDLKQRAMRIGSPQNIILIPWGADPNRFKPVRNKSVIRNDLGLPVNVVCIIAIGRFVYKKGFNYLISVFSEIHKTNKNTHLILCGDGPLYMDLYNQAVSSMQLDAFTFTGMISWYEVPRFLGAADIFVLPSIIDHKGNIDGLPTVLLEAMSTGLPVISSNIGGVSMVINDQQNGIILDPGDETALYRSLERLINSSALRKQMGNMARMKIVDSLNWEQITKQISNILENACS